MNELTNFYKILSDETRLRILLLLMDQKLCVCQMVEILEESQPKISKHLAKLRDHGIITFEKNEQYVFYSINLINKVYYHTLQQIKNEINQYPRLLHDQARSQYANQYFEKNTCRS